MRRTSFLIALVATCWAGGGFVSGCGSDEPARTGSTGNNDDGGSRFNDSGVAQQSVFGGTCLSDTDCPGEGTICLKQSGSDLFGGGPSNGICTAPCATPSDCADFDRNSYCAVTDDNGTPRDDSDDTGFCFESCDYSSGDRTRKCHNRTDMACYPARDGGAFCEPTCRDDMDCDDRVCDLGSGVCVDPSARTGTLPIGAQCDSAAAEDACELGLCAELADGYSVCTGFCTIGELGCGEDRTSGEPLHSYCLPVSPFVGLPDGDFGICYQLCDCNDDCAHPGAVCLGFGGSIDIQTTGHLGACVNQSGLVLDDGGTYGGMPCQGGTSDGGADASFPDSGTSTPPDSGTSKSDAGTMTPKDAATSD